MSLRNVLANLEIMQGLPGELLDAMFARSKVVRLPQGKPLLVSGQENEMMFIVLSGELRVHVGDRLETTIAMLRSGDTVGELSVIDRKPVSATVIAHTDSTLLAVDEPMFWRTVHASHAFAVKLMLKLADRLRANNTTVQANLDLRAELETMALYDALTNVRSRRWLDETLPRLHERHVKDGVPLSVAIVDVDHFKQINDTFGHTSGDAVLVSLANTLMENVRPTDFVARFGGEEFVIVLPNAPLAGAKIAAERVRVAIEATSLMSRQSVMLPGATVSIGVAQLRPGEDVLTWLERADATLYRAKSNGRNRVELDASLEGAATS